MVALLLRCWYLLFLAGWARSGTAAPAEPLPIEDFCRAPSLTHVRLSPEGKHLAAMTSEAGTNYVLLSDLGSGKLQRLPVPPLIDFEWLTEERLLCHVGGGAYGALFAVNIDGSRLTSLADSYFSEAIRRGGRRIRVILPLKVLPQQTDSVLVEDYYVSRDDAWKYPHPHLQRMNYFTGKKSLEEKNPGNVIRWLVDNGGNVRGAIALQKDTVQLLYRRSKTEPWSVVHCSTRDELDLFPAGFGAGSQLYVYTHDGGDILGLYTFDLEEKSLGQCLCRCDQFDLSESAFSRRGALLGAFCDADRVRFLPVDEEYRKVQARFDAALPQKVNVPVGMDPAGGKILYLSYSDRDPGTYYLVDKIRNEFGAVGRSALWIKPELMAPVQPIHYPARDGLTIHGYLTLPLGAATNNLPLIVMPHGGPSARDTWCYDPEVQFLANRGYAVLQVNFRGSTGYGLKFRQAGFKEWGGKMQDDITDGVKWAIANRTADARRVGIFGASYGGYAALMGLITTPELFKCAICYAGVTDVRSITRRKQLQGEFRKEFERAIQEQVGDYREDKVHLQEISPVNLAEKIQSPILLAYGGWDPIVDIEQGRAMARALQKRKKPFELIVEENEGHGFRSEAARSNLLFRIEVFLKEQLSR